MGPRSRRPRSPRDGAWSVAGSLVVAGAFLAGCEGAGGLAGQIVEYVTTPCPFGAHYVVSTDSGTPGLAKLPEKWCEIEDGHGGAVRDGPYVELYESGSKAESGQYRRGVRYGTWTRRYPSGNVDAVIEYENGKPQSFVAWHDNGQKWEEGGFVDGFKQGVWMRWYGNGQKETEASYDHGILVRRYTSWHDNGQKRERGDYLDGQRDGLWTAWHRNGQKRSELFFRVGKPENWYRAWHENGRPAERALFHDGKPEGAYTIWHDNGQKQEEGTYRDGLLEGAVTAWDRDGHVWLKTEYKGGLQVDSAMPDPARAPAAGEESKSMTP